MVALCALLLAAEPFVYKHGEFRFEEWFGFHGIYGFVACVALVLAAKALRRVLKRRRTTMTELSSPPRGR